MTKAEALGLLGGTADAAAEAIGITRQAVDQWPDELPNRIRDRVQAALWRHHQATLGSVTTRIDAVTLGRRTYPRDALTAGVGPDASGRRRDGPGRRETDRLGTGDAAGQRAAA